MLLFRPGFNFFPEFWRATQQPQAAMAIGFEVPTRCSPTPRIAQTKILIAASTRIWSDAPLGWFASFSFFRLGSARLTYFVA
jgi:hypothetical protein